MKIKNLRIFTSISLAVGLVLVSHATPVMAEGAINPLDLEDDTNSLSGILNENGENTYGTYEEALAAKLEKEAELKALGYTNIKSSITAVASEEKSISIVEEGTKENLTLEKVNSFKDLLDEAMAQLYELGDGDYTLLFSYEKTGTKRIEKEFVITDFDSEEEAINAIEKFKSDNNIDETYTFNYEIVSKEVESIVEKGKIDLGLNPTDNEIEAAKNDIYNKYPDCEIEFEVKIVNIGDEVVITTPIDAKTFATLSEAEAYIDELKNANPDYTYELNVNVKNYQVYDQTIEIDSSRIFNTKLEAEEFINDLISTYGESEVIADIYSTTTMEGENGKGTVSYVVKIDRNQAQYIIPKGNNFVLIKQAADYVALWTPTELTKEQKSELESSYARYLSTHNVDGSTTGKLNIIFIYGEQVHDLSYLGNQWGQYGFIVNENGNIVVTNPTGKISHVNYGVADIPYEKTVYYIEGEYRTYKNESEYSVVGNYSIVEYYEDEETALEYIVKSHSMTYSASANAYKEVDKYQATYQINGEFPIYYYIVVVNGTPKKTITTEEDEEIIYRRERDDDIEIIIIPEDIPLTYLPQPEPLPEEEYIEIISEEVPLGNLPQTGTMPNTAGSILGSGMALGGVFGLSLTMKRRKRRI